MPRLIPPGSLVLHLQKSEKVMNPEIYTFSLKFKGITLSKSSDRNKINTSIHQFELNVCTSCWGDDRKFNFSFFSKFKIHNFVINQPFAIIPHLKLLYVKFVLNMCKGSWKNDQKLNGDGRIECRNRVTLYAPVI